MAKGTKTGGRKKGVPNRVTACLRDAIMHAFDTVGGESYLTMVARKHPQVFCMLLARILPMQITGAAGRLIEIAGVSARELIASRIAGISARNGKDENPRGTIQ